jgi:hypothetical protein
MRNGATATAAIAIGAIGARAIGAVATGSYDGGAGAGAGSLADSNSTNWISRQRGDAAGRAEVAGGIEPAGVGFGPAAEEIRGSDIETNFRFDLSSSHYSALYNREMQAER